MFAIGFGLVQGQTGVFHQGLRVTTVQWRAGEAHRAGDADQLIVDEHRLVQRGQHLGGGGVPGFLIGVVDQHGKFVTGKARQYVGRAQGIAQAPRQADQQFVTGLVAKAVVDALEVIDVDQQQAHRRIGVAGKAFVQIADKGRTVAQVGQVVGVRQALDALLGQLALGDVFVDADIVRQLAVVAVHLGNRQLAPIGFEVLAPAFELALPAVAVGQAGVGFQQQLVEVFQRGQFRQLVPGDFLRAVLGDRRETRVYVFDHAVAVDQQKGVGALFDRALEQV